MRTFKVVIKSGCLTHEYISEGEAYFLVSMDGTVCFERVIPEHSGFHVGSFMSTDKFKEALRNNLIQFTD